MQRALTSLSMGTAPCKAQQSMRENCISQRPVIHPLRASQRKSMLRSTILKAANGRILRSKQPHFQNHKINCVTHNDHHNAAVAVKSASGAEAKTDDVFIPVLKPEDLPKGVRKEVRVQGKSVLLFWYRNQIYAIEARSPAEGAYSEGFIRAKFTQDFAIECPATGSLFSLKDGSIVSWYPNNAVLRLLTPSNTCRPLEIYPVKLTQEAIAIDISNASMAGFNTTTTKGGSDTSLENNNVYGLEPKVYVEGVAEEESSNNSNIAQVATGTVAVVAVGAVGIVAVALFKYITQ